jgi:hypothetical protein
MTEADLAKKAMRALRKRTPFVHKIHGGPSQPRGLPDVVGIHCGIGFGIELKAPGKEHTLTPLQRSKLIKIRQAGGVSRIATTVQQCLEVLDVCEKKARRRT